jgi:hypothetical protein
LAAGEETEVAMTQGAEGMAQASQRIDHASS